MRQHQGPRLLGPEESRLLDSQESPTPGYRILDTVYAMSINPCCPRRSTYECRSSYDCNPCNLPLVYLGPGYGGVGFPIGPVTPPTPAPGTAFINSASPAGFSLDIPSGGGAIPEGVITLPVAGTASILPLFVSSPSAGLTAEGVVPGSTQPSLVRATTAGQYTFDAEVCYAPVVGVPTSADFRVLYAYVISAAGVNRQVRVRSQPAVGGATPTCMGLAGSVYLNVGDRLYFAARQTSVSGETVPITVFRASVQAA